jgi:hypothetical protein
MDITAGQVTDGTLTGFVGAGDGFVTTLYDQRVDTSIDRMNFDGTDDEVSIGGEVTATITNKATWAFWINRRAFTPAAGIIAKYIVANGQRGFNIWQHSSGAIGMTLSSDGIANQSISSGNGLLEDNSPIRVVITFNNGVLNFYKNGVFHSTVTSTQTSIHHNNTVNCLIGSYLNNRTNGTIWGVKIANDVASNLQILEDFQAGQSNNSTPFTGLVARIDGYGNRNTDWIDHVGSNNGTVSGSPQRTTTSGLIVSRDVSQGTASSQPTIVSSGALILQNGRPVIDFDGTDDFLSFNGAVTGTAVSAYMVFRRKTTVFSGRPIHINRGLDDALFSIAEKFNSGTTTRFRYLTNSQTANCLFVPNAEWLDNTQYVFSLTATASTSGDVLQSNFTNQTTRSNASGGLVGGAGVSIGAQRNNSLCDSLQFQEVVVYNQSLATNTAEFSANQNNYYTATTNQPRNGHVTTLYDQTVSTRLSYIRPLDQAVTNSWGTAPNTIGSLSGRKLEFMFHCQTLPTAPAGLVGVTDAQGYRYEIYFLNGTFLIFNRDTSAGNSRNYSVTPNVSIVAGQNYKIEVTFGLDGQAPTNFRINGVLQTIPTGFSTVALSATLSSFYINTIGAGVGLGEFKGSSGISDLKVFDTNQITLLRHWDLYTLGSGTRCLLTGTAFTLNGVYVRASRATQVPTKDGIQTTSAQQATIIANGVLNVTSSGVPKIDFNSANSTAYTLRKWANPLALNGQIINITAIASAGNNTTQQALFGFTGAPTNNRSFRVGFYNDGNFFIQMASTGTTAELATLLFAPYSANVTYLMQFQIDLSQANTTDRARIRVNDANTSNQATTLTSMFNSANNPSIGNDFAGATTSFLDGGIVCLLAFRANKTAQQSEIATRLNSVFKVY